VIRGHAAPRPRPAGRSSSRAGAAADAPEVVEIDELPDGLGAERPSGSPAGSAIAAGLTLLVALGGFALAASAFLGEPPLEEKDPAAALPILGNGRIAISQGPDQDVVLIDPEGTDPVTLVDRHGASIPYGLEMAWSPDGSMLAYTDVRDGGLDGLFVLNLATGEVFDVSQGLTSAAKPAWSPDGSRIAFTGADGASGYEIFVVGSDGTGRVPITAEADNGVDGAHMPAWSPDGSRIAFAVDRYDEATETEDHGIVVVDASDGNEIRLTSSLDEQPVWSPDGSKLAFLRKANDVIELYVVNADGSGEPRILGEGASTSLPSWSPDGSRLLFGARGLETSKLGIVVFDVEKGESRTLLADAYVGSPVWSPDGGWIVFVRDDAARPLPRVSLWMIRPDGSGLVELADGLAGVSDVAWQPLPREGSNPSPRPGTPAASTG
jgi:Tol biopolymer transport system component